MSKEMVFVPATEQRSAVVSLPIDTEDRLILSNPGITDTILVSRTHIPELIRVLQAFHADPMVQHLPLPQLKKVEFVSFLKDKFPLLVIIDGASVYGKDSPNSHVVWITDESKIGSVPAFKMKNAAERLYIGDIHKALVEAANEAGWNPVRRFHGYQFAPKTE